LNPKQFSDQIDQAINELRELKKESSLFISEIKAAANNCTGEPKNCPVIKILE
jgi:hypothetical protein